MGGASAAPLLRVSEAARACHDCSSCVRPRWTRMLDAPRIRKILCVGIRACLASGVQRMPLVCPRRSYTRAKRKISGSVVPGGVSAGAIACFCVLGYPKKIREYSGISHLLWYAVGHHDDSGQYHAAQRPDDVSSTRQCSCPQERATRQKAVSWYKVEVNESPRSKLRGIKPPLTSSDGPPVWREEACWTGVELGGVS